MKKILYYAALLFAGTFLTTSCVGDLNQYPHIETTSADVYTSAANTNTKQHLRRKSS